MKWWNRSDHLKWPDAFVVYFVRRDAPLLTQRPQFDRAIGAARQALQKNAIVLILRDSFHIYPIK